MWSVLYQVSHQAPTLIHTVLHKKCNGHYTAGSYLYGIRGGQMTMTTIVSEACNFLEPTLSQMFEFV